MTLSATYTGPAIATPPKGQLVWHSWVPDSEIPRPHRREVRRHVDRAAKRLGLPYITVRWFGPMRGPEPDFWTRSAGTDQIVTGFLVSDQPDTIALNAYVRGPALAACIAHEVKHVTQPGSGLPRDRWEADADAFMRSGLR